VSKGYILLRIVKISTFILYKEMTWEQF